MYPVNPPTMDESIKEAPRPAEPHPVHLPGRSVLVLYGSETGTSAELAGNLGQVAERLHFTTTVEEMNSMRLVCTWFFTIPQARSDLQHAASCFLRNHAVWFYNSISFFNTGIGIRSSCLDTSSSSLSCPRLDKETRPETQSSSGRAFSASNYLLIAFQA